MHPTPADASTVKVTTLELFFDLVFVFTITQVTGLVVKAHSLGDYYRALLVLDR
jgi:low temperature requirement protein LtrA